MCVWGGGGGGGVFIWERDRIIYYMCYDHYCSTREDR